jgi:hypothetical protein
MNIPTTSTIGFLGYFSLGVGIFLILAGIDIFKINQVAVTPGKKTWRAGIIFTILGVVFLVPEISKNIKAYNTELTTTQTMSSTASISVPLIPDKTKVEETENHSLIIISDPLAPDVLNFAASVNFDLEPKGSISHIVGTWNTEWNSGNNEYILGTATILVTNDYWIYVSQIDKNGGQYIIKAKLINNRLVGRYINTYHESDSTPWVGIIVDDNRIDGKWVSGNWNFNRDP